MLKQTCCMDGLDFSQILVLLLVSVSWLTQEDTAKSIYERDLLQELHKCDHIFQFRHSFSNFVTLSSTAESALDSGIAVVMVGASVVIIGAGIGVVVEDWLSLESLIQESSVPMETGSGEFRVRWEYLAKT
ncbi:hypothetical protein Tco_0269720 [Tanacetum coccineum]